VRGLLLFVYDGQDIHVDFVNKDRAFFNKDLKSYVQYIIGDGCVDSISWLHAAIVCYLRPAGLL
jgi:hypothetical protein